MFLFIELKDAYHMEIDTFPLYLLQLVHHEQWTVWTLSDK